MTLKDVGYVVLCLAAFAISVACTMYADSIWYEALR